MTDNQFLSHFAINKKAVASGVSAGDYCFLTRNAKGTGTDSFHEKITFSKVL